jgi:hypothetical protein
MRFVSWRDFGKALSVLAGCWLMRREQNVIDLTLNSAEGASRPLALVNQR